MQALRKEEGDDPQTRVEAMQAVLPRRGPGYRIQEILMR